MKPVGCQPCTPLVRVPGRKASLVWHACAHMPTRALTDNAVCTSALHGGAAPALLDLSGVRVITCCARAPRAGRGGRGSGRRGGRADHAAGRGEDAAAAGGRRQPRAPPVRERGGAPRVIFKGLVAPRATYVRERGGAPRVIFKGLVAPRATYVRERGGAPRVIFKGLVAPRATYVRERGGAPRVVLRVWAARELPADTSSPAPRHAYHCSWVRQAASGFRGECARASC